MMKHSLGKMGTVAYIEWNYYGKHKELDILRDQARMAIGHAEKALIEAKKRLEEAETKLAGEEKSFAFRCASAIGIPNETMWTAKRYHVEYDGEFDDNAFLVIIEPKETT